MNVGSVCRVACWVASDISLSTVRRHGANTTNMHQWCDLSPLYKFLKEHVKHFVPNEALAAKIARVLSQTPGLHLSSAAVSAISGFASVYPAIKGSTTTPAKLGPALAASGSMGADGWPDGDAIIKTPRLAQVHLTLLDCGAIVCVRGCNHDVIVWAYGRG